jgi:hypothetical protein
MHQETTWLCNPVSVVRGWRINEIYGRMTVQYCDNCMNQRKVYKWIERFKEGWTSANDGHSGWPLTVTCFGQGANQSVFLGQMKRN